ncbi:hypothetical protein D3C72_1643620 [compost metagenome]
MLRSPCSDTSLADPAVSPAMTGFQPLERMILRHWPSAWMWLWTVRISSFFTPGITISWKRIGMKYSPMMCRRDSGSR